MAHHLETRIGDEHVGDGGIRAVVDNNYLELDSALTQRTREGTREQVTAAIIERPVRFASLCPSQRSIRRIVRSASANETLR